MPSPIISIKDLNFAYDGSLTLKNVTLDIQPGEFLAIIGPNGGGKSTLIKLMIGLLKPNRGEVLVLGKPPRKVSHHIGYVPQDVAINKAFPISVMDVVLMGRLRFHGRSRITKADRRSAHETLELLGIRSVAHRKIDDLSGGQREKVFIARALITDPDILILDEPTSNLDTTGRSELYVLLKELNTTKTIIVVSHDLMVLSSYVQAVACVNQEVHYHCDAEITDAMLDMGYQCPVELIAHGVPHRILKKHEDL